ncbi:MULTISPECIES: hypothetical protein [Streptomycetaceae]|uniref:hypothetical protein n=1 Tax=Streptomycetaceae TaxID=2062 RepID=UPI0011614C20|nr:hypothetical protein [Streptomyces sp. CB02056]
MMISNASTALATGAGSTSSSPPPWIPYAGFVISLVVALVGLCTFFYNRYRNQRADEEVYAVKVAAWTGEDIGLGPGNLYRFDSLVVHNGSDQPIYNTVLVWRAPEPGELTGETDLQNIFVGLVPPGEDRVFKLPEVSKPEIRQRPVTVAFEDARGRYWERDETGQLHRGKSKVKPELIAPLTVRGEDGSVVPASRKR